MFIAALAVTVGLLAYAVPRMVRAIRRADRHIDAILNPPTVPANQADTPARKENHAA